MCKYMKKSGSFVMLALLSCSRREHAGLRKIYRDCLISFHNYSFLRFFLYAMIVLTMPNTAFIVPATV